MPQPVQSHVKPSRPGPINEWPLKHICLNIMMAKCSVVSRQELVLAFEIGQQRGPFMVMMLRKTRLGRFCSSFSRLCLSVRTRPNIAVLVQRTCKRQPSWAVHTRLGM